MAQLIRIEHPDDGKGIWHSNDDKGWSRINEHSKYWDIGQRHADPNVFPTLWEDKGFRGLIDKIKGTYLFAFLSVEQLRNAFTPEELDEIICKLGFNVYLVEATDTILTNFQGVYHPDSVTLRQDISDLFVLRK